MTSNIIPGIFLTLGLFMQNYSASAEPPTLRSNFEAIGKIDKIELASKLITINGTKFSISNKTIIQPMRGSNETSPDLNTLQKGMKIGYQSAFTKPGEPQFITSIQIMRSE